MKHTSTNFCDSDPIEIHGESHSDPLCGALVSLTQHSGALSFHHAMRPEQARELAAILLTAANDAEQAEVARNRDEVKPS